MSEQQNLALFLLMPITGQHPEWFPRFRDCFLMDESHPEHDGKLQVLTRAGGDFKSDYVKHIKIVEEHPHYVEQVEDIEKGTLTFIFNIPEIFNDDLEKIQANKIDETSLVYKELCKRVFREDQAIITMFELWFDPPQEEVNIQQDGAVLAP
jgi:hypothetical protein